MKTAGQAGAAADKAEQKEFEQQISDQTKAACAISAWVAHSASVAHV